MKSILLLIMTMSLQGRQEKEWESLRLEVTKLFGSAHGVFALAMEDLSTGKRLLINEREMFHAASTMKTPVMIELYRQAGKGKFNLEDSIAVKNEFSSILDGSSYSLSPDDDSDADLYARIGTKMTMRELILRMIAKSSNLATNLLIEFAGAEHVTATMRTLGADSIQVLRGVEDQKAYDKGMNNRTSALDLLVIFKALAKGRIVDDMAREEMMSILEGQEFHDMIPALLPAGTRIAHKTGSITGVEHDSGIVILPDGRQYVLVVLSKGLEEKEEGKRVIAQVSKLIYDFMIKRN